MQSHRSPHAVASLREASKIYLRGDSEVRALDHVNLDIYPGQYVAIMGASGSGKSTLLNVLGTLDLLDSGSYELDGQSIEQLDDDELSRFRSKKLGFVFQAFHLLPRYTALENVALPLRYLRVGRRERLQRAEEALARVGLADRMDHVPAHLSGGQQQRVSLARAIVSRPSLLLADEPTGALDSATTATILDLFDQLHDEGACVVMVTHDPEVGARASRMVRMRDGRVVSDERRGDDQTGQEDIP